MPLRDVRGELEFDNVSFDYHIDLSKLLKDIKRYGRHEDVGAVLSLADKKNGDKMIKKRRFTRGTGS
ncbi:MAG: hypothetical protein U0X93_17035 [Anaerolineales bacterium]